MRKKPVCWNEFFRYTFRPFAHNFHFILRKRKKKCMQYFVIFAVAISSRFYSQPVGWSSPKLTRAQVLFLFVFRAPLLLILLVV